MLLCREGHKQIQYIYAENKRATSYLTPAIVPIKGVFQTCELICSSAPARSTVSAVSACILTSLKVGAQTGPHYFLRQTKDLSIHIRAYWPKPMQPTVEKNPAISTTCVCACLLRLLYRAERASSASLQRRQDPFLLRTLHREVPSCCTPPVLVKTYNIRVRSCGS